MMPRILTACVALTVAIVFAPKLAIQPGADAVPQSHTMTPATDRPAPAPTYEDAQPLGETGVLPAAIDQDLAQFAVSQSLTDPASIRAWASDLDGDGRDDMLVEADFGQDSAGRPVIYHFPYFAEGEGFRRGSTLSLAQPITRVGRDGRALIVWLGDRSLRLEF